MNLANNCLSGVRALSRSPLLGKLRHLDLRNNRITAEGVEMILSSPRASRLKWLDFHGNDLDAETLGRVAAWREQRNPDRRRFTNSLGMDFALIPSGTLLMGSPESEAQRYAAALAQGGQYDAAIKDFEASNPGVSVGTRYLLGPIAAVVIGGAALTGGLASPMSTFVAALFLTGLSQMLRTMGRPVA